VAELYRKGKSCHEIAKIARILYRYQTNSAETRSDNLSEYAADSEYGTQVAAACYRTPIRLTIYSMAG
jgi:hypothetical protein